MAKTDHFCNRAEAYEAHDNEPLSPADRDSIGNIILPPLVKVHFPDRIALVSSLYGAALMAGATLVRESLKRSFCDDVLPRPCSDPRCSLPTWATPKAQAWIASTSRSLPPAWTRPITSPTAIARKSWSDGATRSFPIPPPSIP